MFPLISKPAQPRWFILWQRSIWFAIGLFVITVLAAALFFVIAPHEIQNMTTEGELTSIGKLTALVTLFTFLVAIVLSLIAIILGPATNIWKQQHDPTIAVAWGIVLRSLSLVLGTFAVTLLIVLFAFKPAVENIFNQESITGLSVCSYTFRLVAFEDRNHNGVFGPGERGLPGVMVTANYPSQRSRIPADTASTATSSTAVTDVNGLTSISLSYNYCPSSATEYGKVTLTVATPVGYQATTPTIFGPFTIQWRERFSVQTVYAGFAKTP